MMDAGRHPNIELLVDSEVDDVTGFVGNFRVRVKRKPRYVDTSACTACGECEKVCPVIVPDEYQQGLSSRKAVYMPFPQAVPSSYAIDPQACLGHEPIACGKCLDVCDKKCIDFDETERYMDLEAGAIIVATGMKIYDPRENDEYGYTRFANVVTSMEFERLICAGGPTGGELQRPSDGKHPKRIGFVQCVGSRSGEPGQPYCSNICCMNTVKQTLLLADHYPENESTVFYTDMRAFGKGFEDLYRRSRESGTHYLRGLPGLVEEDPTTGNLIVHAEDTATGHLEHVNLDLLVLSVGLEPHQANGSRSIDQILSLSHTSDGFLMEAHPKLKPVDAPTRGVYFAGCVESPKDIKDSVTQSGAAAARAGNLLSAGQVRIEAITAQLREERCNMCGLCAKVCPYHAITAASKKQGNYPQIVEAACSGCGTCSAECPTDAISMRHFADEQILAQIDGILHESTMEKVLAFACNWCSYAGGDTAGTGRMQYPPTVRLIRTMCSGRVDEKFIWYAFARGAPMVLVSGCHFVDCHYINAVTWTQKRVEKVWNRMEKLGIRPERLQLEWISAAEGQKFARVMTELDRLLRNVSEDEVREAQRIVRENWAKLVRSGTVEVPEPVHVGGDEEEART
jgi:heterodisulfide reductase subunit A